MQRSGRYRRPRLQSATSTAPLLSNDLQAEATLNLDFRSGVLDPRIDFQRTTTGTYYRGPFNQNLLIDSEALNATSWAKLGLSGGAAPIVTANDTIAPNGTLTADKVEFNANLVGGRSLMRQVGYATTVGLSYHYSLWIKGVVGGEQVLIRDTAGTNYALVTATTDWVRVSLAHGAATSTASNFEIEVRPGVSGCNNIAATVWVWGAQVTQGSLLTPYLPTTTAAITQGQIAAAEPWNLFTQSQDIANAGTYTLVGATSANITATAPDGSTTVTQLTESNLNERHLVGRTSYTALPSIDFPVTISVYLKKVSRRYIQLVGISSATSSFSAIFDLDTGTITDTRSQNGSYLGGTMVDVGGGWYRCTISGFTSVAQTALNVVHSDVATFAAGSLLAQSLQYLGDGTSQTLVWGEQLNYGSTALPYRSTTTAALWLPRFENDPITGEARGLLVEGGATNLCLQSAAVRTSPWTTQFLTTAGTSITAPDGTASGVELVPTNGTVSPNAFTYQVISASAATAYTTSVFLKAKGTTLNTVLRVWARSGGTLISTLLVTFNNANGTVGAVSSGTWTATSATSTHVGNGWYRVTLTGTTPATTDGVVQWILFDATGDGVNGVYAWGAQVEAQSFASSYIPTTTATVARGVDSALMTGTNFSSWYNQAAGTVLSEHNASQSNGTRFVGAFNAAGSGTTYVDILRYQVDARAIISISGVTQSSLATATPSSTARKSAHAYEVGFSALSVTGTTVLTGSPASLPTVDTLQIGALNPTNLFLNGTISRLAYWPTRLPNATIQALTT